MKIVIVGAGLTAVTAARTLRTSGFDGELLMIGDEPVLPYERPALSKSFLDGTQAADALALQPRAFFEENDVQLMLGASAVALDVPGRAVLLDRGQRVGFDRLLIATGSRARRLDVPGSSYRGVHTLRTSRDAERLRAELTQARRVVVVGGGLIGLEVAATARRLGKEVTVLEHEATPLRRSLGRAWGQAVAELHRRHGVELRTGVSVTGFQGTHDRVSAIELREGAPVAADLVVVAVGSEPNVEWLEGSGVALERGVVVDDTGRTSVDGVFAAGEVASRWVPSVARRLRIEHFGATEAHATAVAKTMAGVDTPLEPELSVGSEQFGVRLQMYGFPRDDLRTVVRGDVEGHRFVALFVDGSDRVRAGFVMGAPRFGPVVRRLVAARLRIDTAAVSRTSDAPLEELLSMG